MKENQRFGSEGMSKSSSALGLEKLFGFVLVGWVFFFGGGGDDRERRFFFPCIFLFLLFYRKKEVKNEIEM